MAAKVTVITPDPAATTANLTASPVTTANLTASPVTMVNLTPNPAAIIVADTMVSRKLTRAILPTVILLSVLG